MNPRMHIKVGPIFSLTTDLEYVQGNTYRQIIQRLETQYNIRITLEGAFISFNYAELRPGDLDNAPISPGEMHISAAV